MANDKPIKKFKVGGVQVAVWENTVVGRDGGEESLRSVTMERRYKDRSGNWKSAPSLHVGDLPKAILALSKAYEVLALEDNTKSGGDAD